MKSIRLLVSTVTLGASLIAASGQVLAVMVPSWYMDQIAEEQSATTTTTTETKTKTKTKTTTTDEDGNNTKTKIKTTTTTTGTTTTGGRRK